MRINKKPKRQFFGFSVDPTHHGLWEDIQGIIVSVILVAFAMGLFQNLGLVTSGIAGLAIILNYSTGLPTGLLFFALNIPFYILAVIRLGWIFAFKTFCAVVLLAILIDLQSRLIVFEVINPVFGSVLGGVLMGFGLLGVFRHRASLGGVGILSVWLQDRFGVRAGLTLLIFDMFIFVFAMFVVSWQLLGFSIVGAVVLNIFLVINHRTDRYIAR